MASRRGHYLSNINVVWAGSPFPSPGTSFEFCENRPGSRLRGFACAGEAFSEKSGVDPALNAVLEIDGAEVGVCDRSAGERCGALPAGIGQGLENSRLDLARMGADVQPANLCVKRVQRGGDHFTFGALNIHIDQINSFFVLQKFGQGHGWDSDVGRVREFCEPEAFADDCLSVPCLRVSDRKPDGAAGGIHRGFDQAVIRGIETIIGEMRLHHFVM